MTATVLSGSSIFGVRALFWDLNVVADVPDRGDFAWLCDVFIDEGHRGKGLGKWLLETVHGHTELQGLRRWILGTRDAHELYKQIGYTPIAKPEIFMERYDPEVYER